ncbi:MAG: insulinase family protein [Nitrospinae bacterium]|nr:insulinase family protein [Nitrospinota bacterium]
MSLETNRTYHGFKLVRQETLPELKSLALLFEHETTGAQTLVLENDDDNKVFGIAFRTPPGNHTGVAHILEHSVLCGSRKYPVKEPFLELMKGSLQTFLNAMTFPDKTMYPVASRNLKDFYNLMNVYLDAVFHPRITEEIFMQEGWHYELESPEDEISYKGVVYNEMKGVFSSPENLVDRYQAHALFPATVYGYESGGDPDRIPDLTYAEFREFHRKYYHPSNSRIFLYGDGPTLEHLRFLHEDYLKDFARTDVNSAIHCQRKFRKPRRKAVYYPVSRKESLEKKTYVSVGLKLHKSSDHEHCLAFHILGHLLLGTHASPLRKALIDSGLGSEVIGGGFDDQRAETLFVAGLKGTEPEHEQKIVDLIFSTLRDLAEKGIDENMVKASVNTMDFKLREANFGGFPKGIVYNMQALSSWLYDADPLTPLRYEELMAKIKKKSSNGYFEKLIGKYLLDNNHQARVVGIPKPGLKNRQESKTRKKLKAYKASLPPQDVADLTEKTKTLQRLQTTPDSPEALATLPKLGLEDLNKNIPVFPIETKREDRPKILFHDLFTNKIAYLQVGFDTRSVPLDKIQYLPLLGKLMLGMGSQRRSYVEISQAIGIHTGGIRSSHFTSAPLMERQNILSYVFFNGKAVMDKLGNLFDIYSELLAEYKFDDPKRLVEIVRGEKADMEDSIIPNGNQYVSSRLQSYHSRLGKFDELTDGISYFKFLEGLLERAEKNPGEVIARFKETAEILLTRENMLVNVTSESADYSRFEGPIDSLAQRLAVSSLPPAALEFGETAVNEAFATASAVQYVGKGANLYDLGFEHSGKFDVLKSVLGAGYLWDRVRVQGGAYGCSSSFDKHTGDFVLVSYRDPNLEETLTIYDEIADFLENLDLSRDELTKFIIGCVGHLDPPLTPDRKGMISMVERLTGLTTEIKQRRRDEMLATTLQDLKNYAPLFKTIKQSGTVCVLGNEDKIKKSKRLFQQVIKVFN